MGLAEKSKDSCCLVLMLCLPDNQPCHPHTICNLICGPFWITHHSLFFSCSFSGSLVPQPHYRQLIMPTSSGHQNTFVSFPTSESLITSFQVVEKESVHFSPTAMYAPRSYPISPCLTLPNFHSVVQYLRKKTKFKIEP